MRSFSFSEASTALDCWARHAFSYTGRLSQGTALKPKALAPILREGRAWGAALAVWHMTDSVELAVEALDASLDEDAERQREFGLYLPAEHEATRTYLFDLLTHEIQTAERFSNLTRLEQPLEVAIPSRGGKRPSSLYRFLCKIDGWLYDVYGQAWIVEFKLRSELYDAWLIQLSRQMRWYSWAWMRQSGIQPVGVLMVERLNELPKSPKIVNAKRKGEGVGGKVPSHDKSQRTDPDAYLAVCGEYGVEPSPDALEAYRARRWTQQVPIMFRKDELDEAGEELVTAAKLIRNLDSGEFYPLRNAHPRNCRGCRFKEICPAPDAELVDMLFERVPPKRLREVELGSAAAA